MEFAYEISIEFAYGISIEFAYGIYYTILSNVRSTTHVHDPLRINPTFRSTTETSINCFELRVLKLFTSYLFRLQGPAQYINANMEFSPLKM